MNKLILAAILSALTLPAYADPTVNGKISTLGLGAEAVFSMTKSVDARIGLNTFKYGLNKTTTSSNGLTTNFNADLNLQNLQAMADWHPSEGSFRVSGGIVYNNNNFTMTAQPSAGNISIGGVNYAVQAGQSVNATVDFNKVAPYLGIGWGRTPKNTGLSFTSDIGIMYQGSPNGNVTTNIAGVAPADVSKANADLKDALKSFNIYPVLSIGVGYAW